MPETVEERYRRLQAEANAAYSAYLLEQQPKLGPDTEVWVSHTLETTRKMTIKDLALQIRVPVADLIQHDSLKDAGSVVEKSAEWIDKESLEGENGWEIESNFWSVTEVR